MTSAEREQLKADIRELIELRRRVAGQNDPRSQWLHDLVSANIVSRRTRLEQAAQSDTAASSPRRHLGREMRRRLSALRPSRWTNVKATISEFSYRKRGTV